MSIDPKVLRRQREEVVEASITHRLGGMPMTNRLCRQCGERFLGKLNTSGVCYVCWDGMSKKARALYRGEKWETRAPTKPRARPETIEKARAKLAAKGIVVEAA